MITVKRLFPLSILTSIAVSPTYADFGTKEIMPESQNMTSYSVQGANLKSLSGLLENDTMLNSNSSNASSEVNGTAESEMSDMNPSGILPDTDSTDSMMSDSTSVSTLVDSSDVLPNEETASPSTSDAAITSSDVFLPTPASNTARSRMMSLFGSNDLLNMFQKSGFVLNKIKLVLMPQKDFMT